MAVNAVRPAPFLVKPNEPPLSEITPLRTRSLPVGCPMNELAVRLILPSFVEPLPLDRSNPLENYRLIRRELDLHSRALADKPEIVVVSKAELTGAEEVRQRLEQELGRPVLGISAVTGQGLAGLVSGVVDQLAALPVEAGA